MSNSTVAIFVFDFHMILLHKFMEVSYGVLSMCLSCNIDRAELFFFCPL